MKLKQLLDTFDCFDGELIVKDSYDSEFSFCWDNYTKITKEGKQKFSKILNSEVKQDSNVLILQDTTITEEEYNIFMAAVAGYVPITLYNIWFKEKEAI